MRSVGVPDIDGLPLFGHILHIFNHGKELLNISAQFCRAGLEAGECCVWITTPPWSTAIALHELLLYQMPDAQRYVDSGQLRFVEYDDWYMVGGRFDPHAILNNAIAHVEQAQAQGWSRIRLCGQPCRPGADMDWCSVLSYERQIQEHLRVQKLLVLCAYRAGSLREPIKSELLHTHDAVLERANDYWGVYPHAVLSPDRAPASGSSK